MIQDIYDHCNEHNKYAPIATNEDLFEFLECSSKIVHKELYDEHRWYNSYEVVSKVDSKYIRFYQDKATGDGEVDQDYSDGAFSFVEPYEETVTRYK